jgi:hypothetical protein
MPISPRRWLRLLLAAGLLGFGILLAQIPKLLWHDQGWPAAASYLVLALGYFLPLAMWLRTKKCPVCHAEADYLWDNAMGCERCTRWADDG